MSILKYKHIERNVTPLLYPTTSNFSPVGVRGGKIFRYDYDKFKSNPFKYLSIIPHHIHILSNDNISKGDYVYDEKKISQVTKVGSGFVYTQDSNEPIRKFIVQKIIASSDKLLGLPIISDYLIEEIVYDFRSMCNVIASLIETDDYSVYDINDEYQLEISRVDRLNDFNSMEPDDLMIGNFVYNQNSVYKILAGDDIDFCEEYLPIIITEYWLSKFRFNKI